MQLALYQWLDAFARMQRIVHDERMRMACLDMASSEAEGKGWGARGCPRRSSLKKDSSDPRARGAVARSASSSASVTTVTCDGEAREANADRRVLLGGDAPRPRGRAPAATPWWDIVEVRWTRIDGD